MAFSEPYNDTVSVQLPNGAITKVEVTAIGREDVKFGVKQFQPIADVIEGIVEMIAIPIQKAKPQKAVVKFSIELALESGELTAVIVKGSSKANLEIALEWEN